MSSELKTKPGSISLQPTKVTVIPGRELTAEHVEVWGKLQQADPALDSPFFRPEFTQAVASVRPDVEVAVLENKGEPVGFFPFQRGIFGIGRPVGARISDFQGLIVQQGLEWNPQELLRLARLASWDFDHLLVAQAPFQPHIISVEPSPYLDLSRGFEAYQKERKQGGSMLLSNTLRKARKFEREVGPLRFEFHTTDPKALTSLFEWKSAQYRRTEATDVFTFAWVQELLKRIISESRPAFAGVLSALYVGEQLAAVHLGMRSAKVMHYWFPTYDIAFSKYSPGLILLLEMARAAAAQGIYRLDLGKGDKDYKTSFMSGTIPVALGCVSRRPFRPLVQRGLHWTRNWAQSSRFGGPVRLAGQWTRTLRNWLAFR